MLPMLVNDIWIEVTVSIEDIFYIIRISFTIYWEFQVTTHFTYQLHQGSDHSLWGTAPYQNALNLCSLLYEILSGWCAYVWGTQCNVESDAGWEPDIQRNNRKLIKLLYLKTIEKHRLQRHQKANLKKISCWYNHCYNHFF